MAGKARVHELAKELGKTSKEIMAKLTDMGEFVKSPSSTIEAPVVRKLRDAFPATKPAAKTEPSTNGSNGAAAARTTPSPAGGPGRPGHGRPAAGSAPHRPRCLRRRSAAPAAPATSPAPGGQPGRQCSGSRPPVRRSPAAQGGRRRQLHRRHRAPAPRVLVSRHPLRRQLRLRRPRLRPSVRRPRPHGAGRRGCPGPRHPVRPVRPAVFRSSASSADGQQPVRCPAAA